MVIGRGLKPATMEVFLRAAICPKTEIEIVWEAEKDLVGRTGCAVEL
jgi:hypothetical protein